MEIKIMEKKVLILTASARKNSNSTEMANTFAKIAESKGYTVKIVNTITLNIKPCHGCGMCYKKETPCVFNDDFTQLSPDIINADVIVFATPVYWYNFPTQMKAVIDKFITFAWGKIAVDGKRCALLTCAEEQNASYVFEGISITYDKVTRFMRWESMGKVMQQSVWNAGDIKMTDALKAVENIANNL